MDRRKILGMTEDGEIYGNGFCLVLVCSTEIKVNKYVENDWYKLELIFSVFIT